MRLGLHVLLIVMISASTIQPLKAAVNELGTESKTASLSQLSEKDTYLDLNTGKEFRVMYDDLNEIFNREDLFALDLYVNLRTKDTFWLDQALLVNNALLKDEGGIYKVDPMKVKRDGNGYKVRPGLDQSRGKVVVIEPGKKETLVEPVKKEVAITPSKESESVLKPKYEYNPTPADQSAVRETKVGM